MAKNTHSQWSSRMGFVLAATGSAVGLGNIWKFPYMVGQSGGAAFVLVYLACIALIGVPILVSEWMIGRRGQKNPINTMAQLARDNGHSTNWAVVGAVGVFAAFLILSFYSVIGGWALAYMRDAATGAFCHGDTPTLADCVLVPQIFNAQRFHCRLDHVPTVMRVFEACMARPAFQAAQPSSCPDAEA